MPAGTGAAQYPRPNPIMRNTAPPTDADHLLQHEDLAGTLRQQLQEVEASMRKLADPLPKVEPPRVARKRRFVLPE